MNRIDSSTSSRRPSRADQAILPAGERALGACFRCSGRLRHYLRSGIPVEQCEECRGIFLDGGELERLIDAEGGGWSGQVGTPWPTSREQGEPLAAPVGGSDR
jgi:Zn-finger nucleic acid-binding protein